jgi:predicted nucleotidyltransferase
MERVLAQLTDRLKATFGDRLVSVVLYGSAASGDHHGRFSDINILCALRQITPRELGDSEPIFRWWRELGNPAPLLLSEQEVRTSSDCFPIEFRDLKDRRRVLHGADILAEVEIDYSFYRAQVEHELRAKLLRLRQKAAGILSDKDLLLRLLTDSVTTFAVLFRHALLLSGSEPGHQKRDVFSTARERFGIDAAPFETLLELREGSGKARKLDPPALFANYLAQIQVVLDAVDVLAK